MPATPPRIAPLEESAWTDEIRALLRPDPSSPRPPLHIFTTLAHHPRLLASWLVFGRHVLLESTLSRRQRELVILRVGWRCRAEYEWGQHVRMALDAGLDREEIERVRAGADAPGWDPLDALLLRAADELLRDAEIGDTTWQRLAAHLSTQQLIDLVFTVGQYHLVAMAVKTLRVPLDPGLEGLPESP